MKNFTENAAQTRESLRVLGNNLRSISKEIENCSYLLLENPNGSKSAPLAISILNMFANDCIELQKKILYIDGALKRVSEEMPGCDAAKVFNPITDEKLNSYIVNCISKMSSQAGCLFALAFGHFLNNGLPQTVEIRIGDVLTESDVRALDDLEDYEGSSRGIMNEILSIKPYVELSGEKSFKFGRPISRVNINSESRIMTVEFTKRFIDCIKNRS